MDEYRLLDAALRMVVYECLAGSPRPAPSGANLWSPPAGLQPAGDLLGLLRIFLARAPEDEATGDFSDGDRNTELYGHTEDAVFHRGWAGAVRERHAGGGVV